MRISNFLIAFLVTCYLLPVTANAQTASPSTTPKASVSPKPSVTPTASPSPSPGKSIRDNLRERVEEKLNKLSNKPRAFVGKITQIPNASITLETKSGVKQVKITEKTVLVQVTSGKQKTIKESDLVVGDFVVAMGFVENKDTLSAARILTMTENPLRARHPVYGVVQNIDKGTFTVKHPKKDGSTGSPQDETWTIKTSGSTRITAKIDGKIEKVGILEIEVEDRIIAVGEPVKNTTNTIQAKLINVIPGAAHGLTKSPTASPKATKSPAPPVSPTP